MDLKKALQLCTTFAGDGDHAYIYVVPHVFPTELPSTDEVLLPITMGYVSAGNEDMAIAVELDLEVVVDGGKVPVSQAKVICSSLLKGFTFKRISSEWGVAIGTKDENINFPLMPLSGAIPLTPPTTGLFQRCPGMHNASRTVFAGQEDKTRPLLSYVHLTPTFAECSSQFHAARVNVSIPLPTKGILVHKQMFEKWPKEVVPTLINLDRDHFTMCLTSKAGAEYRRCKRKDDKDYFDLNHFFPLRWAGSLTTVSTEEFKAATRMASKSSPNDICLLRFDESHPDKDNITVVGLDQEQGVSASSMVLKGANALHSAVVAIKGRLLSDALAEFSDTTMKVGYSTSRAPLHLVSEHLMATVWPLVQAEEV